MQIKRSVAMVLNWPSIQTRTFDFSTFSFKEKPYSDAKKEYDKNVNALSDWLNRARHYAQAKEKGSPALYERDLKLEALVPVVEGKLPVLVIADDERDIRNAVEFCSKQNLKMILAGGAEAWKVTELSEGKENSGDFRSDGAAAGTRGHALRQADDAAFGIIRGGHSVCVFQFRNFFFAAFAAIRRDFRGLWIAA